MRHAEAGQQAANEIARGVVCLYETQNVIALLRQCDQGMRNRPNAGRRNQAILTTLQSGQRQFELPSRRVGSARIEEPRPTAMQEASGFLEAVKLEFDRLVDR